MNAKLRRVHRRRLLLSFGMFVLFAGCFSLMPWASAQKLKGAPGPMIGLGAALWLTGVSAVVLLYRADRARKTLSAGKGKTERRTLPGLLRFFQNPAAFAADCLLLIGLLYFVLAKYYERPNPTLFPAVSVLLLLVIVHAFLNGSNYRILHTGHDSRQKYKRSKQQNEK